MADVTLAVDRIAQDLRRTADEVEKALRSETLKKKIAVLSVSGVKDHFDKGNSPEGVPWVPLRIRQGRPLLDTGRLRASIQGRVTATGVQVGTNAIQAGVHQFGATIRAKQGKYLAIPLADGGIALVPSVFIPARPFMGFSTRTLDRVEQLIGDEIARVVAGG